MIAYFLAVTVSWAACLALYAALFRGEKFFHVNRAYLILTLALGLIIPLVEWPETAVPVQANWIGEAIKLPEFTLRPDAQQGGEMDPIQWILMGYLLGSAWMAIRYLNQLFKLALLVRNGKISRQFGYYTVADKRVNSPFSFLNFLFWNPALDEDPDSARTIRSHELAHIRQGHSIDLIFVEITGIFFWWNPLWHAYSHAIRNIHEYLADEAAIRETTARDYGLLLIRQCLSPSAPVLSHGLKNHSQLQNRIAMMTKSNSPKLALAKYLTLLPLLAFLLFACAQPDKEELGKPVEPTAKLTDSIFQEAEIMPVFGACVGLEGEALSKCSFDNLIGYLGSQLRYPEEAKAAKVEGQVVVSFVVLASGQVDQVKIIKSLAPSCDAEVERLVREMPVWQPGETNGKPVNVELKLPVQFRLQ